MNVSYISFPFTLCIFYVLLCTEISKSKTSQSLLFLFGEDSLLSNVASNEHFRCGLAEVVQAVS